MSDEVISLEHVDASYGSYRALFDVSFSVPSGALVALLGANGAGKSTVARVATGLVPKTAGRLRVCGHDTDHMASWQIARLGVAHVPEGRGIFGDLSVEENLILSFRQRLGRKEVRSAIERAYGAMPVLAQRRHQVAKTLSGGQQRMLSLGKVLAAPPKVLIADELSLGLAPVIVESVYEHLRTINANGTAVLVVEQQVSRVLQLAESSVILEKGRVAWQGPSGEAHRAMEAVLAGAARETGRLEVGS